MLLARRLAGLVVKRPGLALGLWGEPGIGKTHAALALLRGAPCQSLTVHATQPREGIVGAIPRPKKASIWLERSLERLERGEPQEIGTLIQTLAALLTANAPLILHVEDLHEASEERLEFWKELALVVARTRGVGLLATSRVQPPEGFEAIRLSALNREASDALLEAEAGATLPSEALAWVFEQAVGNPLFTLEFFRFLARQGFLWNDNHRWRWRSPEHKAMPVTVEALIEQLLREATGTPALEDAINAKAVLGLGVGDDLWAEVAGLTPEDLSAVKRELEGQGVLSGGDFAHPLYREVIAHALPTARRETLARRALKARETDPRAAAEFVKNAGLESSEALGWLERAAHAAIGVGNEVQAARFKAKAVEYATGNARARLAFEAAQALQHHDKREATRYAAEAVDAQPEHAEPIYLYALLLAGQQRGDEVEQALKRLREPDYDNERGLSVRIECRVVLSDYRGALELWRAHPELEAATTPQLGRRLGSAMVNLGETANAFALASALLERTDLDGLTRMRLVELCGITRFYESDYAAAEAFFGEAIRILREASLTNRASTVLYNHGLALQRLGRYRLAVADVEEAARIASEVGDGSNYTLTRGLLGEQLFELGDYDRAEEVLLEARNVLERGRSTEHWVDLEGNLSDLYRERGSAHSGALALKYGHAALTYARQLENPRFLPEGLFYAAIAEALFGSATQALRLAEEERDLAAVRQEPRQVYKAGWARAAALNALGRHDEALNGFRQAQESALRVGVMLHVHKIGLEIDRLTGDADSAQKRLVWFEERGLTNGANIARRYFPELAQDRLSRDASKLEPKSLARLGVLGPMQLQIEGTITPLRGGTRKELLALLLEARIRGRSEVTSLDLCDALYPLEPEEAALGALRATIFKIRSSLGTDLIATTPNGYALGPVASDAEEFLLTGDTGLWRGPYLEDAALEGRDENVREALHHALEMRARALLEGATPDFTEAARLGRLLVLAEPYDLGTLDLACRALRASQNRGGLSRLYAEARARLLEVGEVLPEHSADFLKAQLS